MKNYQMRIAALVTAAAIVSACAPSAPDTKKAPVDVIPAYPEVTDENCSNDNIAKLDARIRAGFGDLCFKSGPGVRHNSGKTW